MSGSPEGDGWAGAPAALASLAFAAYVGSTFARGSVTPTEAGVAYVLLLVVSIVAHELAHAAVGALVGAEVTGMRLGFGPRLTRAGSWLDLRPLIVAAHVSYLPPRGARRWQEAAIGIAGIALHAIVIVAVLAAGGAHPVWVSELLFANVIALVSNAIPLNGGLTTTSGGANDGMQLLRLARRRGPYLSGADPDLQDLVRAYDTGGVAAAETALAALARPDAPYLRMTLVRLLVSAQRWVDARALVPGAADPGRPWAPDHLAAEAGAMELVVTGRRDPGLLAETDRRATAAQTAVGTAAVPAERAAVAHTVALVRLLQERSADAVAICAWALEGTATAADRAAVLATQGWAELGLGHHPAAAALLHEAVALDRTGPLVSAFAAAFSQAPAAP